MEFKKITNTESEDFRKAWAIYEEAFPDDERRRLEVQKKVMEKSEYSFKAIYENDKLIGLFADWEIGDFLFGEHFAIQKDLRDKGLGGTAFKAYLDKVSKRIFIGEVERPEEGEMAIRRIGFYKRLGMKLNEWDYIQPAYGPGKAPLPLYLITYPKEINKQEFENIRLGIHLKVYGLSEPLISI